jgi:anthranilate phosphoribosyltransferase
VAGGEPAENVEIFKRLLDGEDGPIMDFVLLQAGAALFVVREINFYLITL